MIRKLNDVEEGIEQLTGLSFENLWSCKLLSWIEIRFFLKKNLEKMQFK